MLQRDNAIVFLASGLDACAMWRLWQPHQNMPGSSFFCFRQQVNFNFVTGADIVVVQRLCTQPQWEFISVCKKLGLKVVYDLDDNMWEVPQTNPAYNSLMQYKMGFIECMKIVDAITVSTKNLSRVVAKHIRTYIQRDLPVYVVENRMDERLYSAPRPPREKVIVGWAGSSSHVGDLRIALPGLLQTAAENPDVTFQFRGLEPPQELKHLPNVDFKLWTPVAEFVARMPQWGWSIGLAPLEEHPFNESKSCIKLLESAYCRVPCLASWLEPYDYFTSFDPELRWLLCAGKSNWAPKIRELIHDEARRKELGERAYRVLQNHLSYGRPHEGWEKVLADVRSQSAVQLSARVM